MTCTHDCNQGRACTCMPITMEDDEPVVTFDNIVDYAFSLFAAIGVLATTGGIAFLVGVYL